MKQSPHLKWRIYIYMCVFLLFGEAFLIFARNNKTLNGSNSLIQSKFHYRIVIVGIIIHRNRNIWFYNNLYYEIQYIQWRPRNFTPTMIYIYIDSHPKNANIDIIIIATMITLMLTINDDNVDDGRGITRVAGEAWRLSQ